MIKKHLAKKGIVVFAAMFISLVPIQSFGGSWNGWIYQNPYPTSNHLYAVKFVTPKKGWIAGEQGVILYTENGGETWEYQESGTEQTIKSLFFINERQGWAVGGESRTREKGVIVHTEDGGKSWVQQQGDFNSPLNSVLFLSEKEGWIVGNQGILLHTIDAGKKWERQRSLGVMRAIASVYFINARTGWILAGDEIYRTTDGGKNWDRTWLDITLPRGGGVAMDITGAPMPPEWNQGEIYFINEKKGWAVTGFWHIFSTEDGGKTWTNQFSTKAMSYDLRHISFSDDKKGCAAGSSIICTEDGGKTWNERLGIKSGENEFRDGFTISVWGLDFAGQSEGWAVGNDGQILKTENSGKNWKIKNRNPMTEAIYFFNAKTGWALKGRYDDLERKSIVGIARTDDGGDTWKVQKEFETPINLRFFFINPTTGWAVGWQWEHNPSFGYTILNALILHTGDGGKTWETQFEKQGSDLALLDAHFIDANVGWIVGSNGLILHTRNGGKHWEQQKSGTKFRLEKVHFIDDKRGWAIGAKGGALDWLDDEAVVGRVGIVLQTEDGGRRWNTQLKKKDAWLNGLFFIDRDTGWITGKMFIKGKRGLIFSTNNGGKAWVEKDMNGDYPGIPFFTDKRRGWIPVLTETNYLLTKDRLFFITEDSGKTWKKQKMPLHKYPWKPFESSKNEQ